MAEKPKYPVGRPKFFAHKFCRVLAKACVANELGVDVCWFLTVIAHTEDAGAYRKAVTYHNGQLMSFCGFGSESKLKRARTKAVQAGWLAYIPGSRGGAARYWVVLPDAYKGMDDMPSDERPEKFGLHISDATSVIESTGDTPSELHLDAMVTPAQPIVKIVANESTGDPLSGLNSDSKRTLSGLNPDSNRSTLFPYPVPVPDPVPKDRQTDPQTPEVGQAARYDPLKADQAARKLFEARWKEAGLRKFSFLSASLKGRLQALLLIPEWADNYATAIARAGTIPFLRDGLERRNGPLDVSEFLGDGDMVRKLIDGVLDPRVHTQTPSQPVIKEPSARPPTKFEMAHMNYSGTSGAARDADGNLILDQLCRDPECEHCKPRRQEVAA